MLVFLLLSALALAALGVGGALVLPFLLLGAVLWLATWPIRFLFRLVFGVLGALLGLLVAPVVIVAVGFALLVAFAATVIALLAPLVPVVLVLLLGWAVYRFAIQPSAA